MRQIRNGRQFNEISKQKCTVSSPLTNKSKIKKAIIKLQRTKLKSEQFKSLNQHTSVQYLFNQAANCSFDIKSVILDLQTSHCTREELIIIIRAILKYYPSLKLNPFKIAINNVIIFQIAKRFQFAIKNDDLESMWRSSSNRNKSKQFTLDQN
jgi:hypothetical protein